VSASDLGTETDTNQNQQLCYHVLGQPQSKDVVVLADPEHPLWMFGAEVTDDGRCGQRGVCVGAAQPVLGHSCHKCWGAHTFEPSTAGRSSTTAAAAAAPSSSAAAAGTWSSM
jgi:hypothetical protein